MKFRHIFLLFSLVLSNSLFAQKRTGIQDYSNIANIQAETIIPKDNDKIYVKAINTLLSWDATSTATHDGINVIKQTSIATGRFIKVNPSVTAATIQQLNVTSNVSSWNSVVEIGATPLTANVILTLPTTAGNIGKEITFKRLDATAFTVSIIANGAEILQLNNTGSELNNQYGALTVQSVSATKAEQVSNIAMGSQIITPLAFFTASANTSNSSNGLFAKTNVTGVGSATLTTASRLNITPTGWAGATSSNTLSNNITVNADNVVITQAGRYKITSVASIYDNTQNATTVQWIQIYRNNTVIKSSFGVQGNIVTGGVPSTAVTAIADITIDLNVGDIIDTRGQQSNASQLIVSGMTFTVQQLPTSVSQSTPAGNVTVDYGYYTSNSGTLTSGATYNFNTRVEGNIPFTAGQFTLSAGKTYRLSASFAGNNGGTANASWLWYNVTASTPIVSGAAFFGTGGLNGAIGNGAGDVVFTPTVTTIVEVRGSGSAAVVASASWAVIQQIGSTASLENQSLNVANLPTGGALQASTIDPYVLGFNVAQTTANQVVSIPNPTTITINRVIYINNTGTVAFQVHGFTVSAGQTQSFVWNGAAWSNFTNNTNQNVISENGENTTITHAGTFSTTLADIAGSSFTIPSAGTWKISYTVFASPSASTNFSIGIYDNANVLVPNSQGIGNPQTINEVVPVINTVIITTIGATTYKLRGIANAGTITIRNTGVSVSSAANSKILWVKIGGFLPISGNLNENVLTGLTAGQTLPATGNPITLIAKTGSVLSVASNQVVLNGGKSYKMLATISRLNGTANVAEIAYQFRNVTDGVYIGNEGTVTQNTNLGAGSTAMADIVVPAGTTKTIQLWVTKNASAGSIVINGSSATGGAGSFYVSQDGTSAYTTLNPIDLNTGQVTGILPIANGGTGSATQDFVDLTTAQTVLGNKTFNGNTVLGSVGFNTVTTTAASYTALTTDAVILLTLNGSQTLTMPNAASFAKRIIKVSNNQPVQKTISVFTTRFDYTETRLQPHSWIELQSDGTVWREIASSDSQYEIFGTPASNTIGVLGGITFTTSWGDPWTLTTSSTATGYIMSSITPTTSGGIVDAWQTTVTSGGGAELFRGGSWNSVTTRSIGLYSSGFSCITRGHLNVGARLYQIEGSANAGNSGVIRIKVVR